VALTVAVKVNTPGPPPKPPQSWTKLLVPATVPSS
jgi:hypothetical protein